MFKPETKGEQMSYDDAVDYLVEECDYGFDYEDAETALDVLPNSMSIKEKLKNISERLAK